VTAPPSSTDPPREPRRPALRQRLQWQTVGRLVVATLLLGGTLLLAARDSSYSSFTPSVLIALIVGTYGIAGLSALAAEGRRSPNVIAWGQIIWDVVLASGLVYVSGAAASVFTILYGVTVLNAALVLGPRESTRVAAICSLVYLVLGVSVSSGWIPQPPDQHPRQYTLALEELGFSILSNTVGLFVVAALAANLSTRLRRAGGRVAVAEAQTAALLQLQDDIVRSISAGLVTTDLDGCIRTLNPAASRMLQAESHALVGTALHDVLPVDEAPRERGETFAERRDGTRFPVGFTATPLLDAEGARSGTLVVFQDLTEIQTLRQQAERAERLAALGRLASGLAHEIRNPLGAISGSVQMVRDTKELDPEDRHLLGIVLEEVERLNELVSTMLDVGGRHSLPRPHPEDLVTLVREVVEVASGDTTLGDVRIEVEAEDDLVAEVDAGQIRQVVWNLLKNAIQASSAEGVVTIALRREGDEALVEVRDQGKGIPEEQRQRLFEMFYSGRDQGIGLGLALVKQIVDAHVGRVEVESELGEGAVFRVCLPLRSAMLARDAV